MNRQRARKEWAIKARVERETAVKCTQCYVMCAQLTTLSLPCFSAWLNRRPTGPVPWPESCRGVMPSTTFSQL